MEDIIDIIVTETTNLIEITSQPTDEIIDVNIIDNREDITLNVTPSVVEININSLTGNFGVNWGDIEGTLSNQTDLQAVLNAKADLVDGKVPSSQLPSYVDDVVEVANYAALPVTGEVGKIYITLDTNFIYRWSGSTYIEIKDSSAVWGAITGTLSSQTDLQSALDAKVPYTGATGNVNLGEYGATVGYLGFDTTPTSTPTGIGTTYWDSFYRTLSLIDGDGDTTLQIGQEERVLVHNNTGSTLTDGQVVYVTGSTGELPSVALASNTSESTSSVTFGIVTESIAHGANGFITTSGIIHGLNTNAYDEGAAIYLGSTAGTFTQTKPVAPANSVLVGYIIKKSGGNGSIFVKIQNGSELDELHDVLITSIANNDGLFYESSTSLWKNKSIATVLGYTPANGANYLPLTGGTLTGALNGTSANFSSYLNAQTIDISNSTAANALRITHTNGSYHAVSIVATGNSALYASGNVTVVGTITSTGVISAQSGLANGIGQSFALPTTSGTLALTSQLSSYLPLSGGTLTGALSGTSATFSGSITNAGNIFTANDAVFSTAGSITKHSVVGLALKGATGSVFDFSVYSPGGTAIITNPTGTLNIGFAGAATFSSSVTASKDGAGNANTNTTGSQLILTRTAGGVEILGIRNTGASNGIYGTGYTAQIISDGNNAIEMYTTGAQPLILGTNASTRLVITSAGNVGIGTTAPSYLLHLVPPSTSTDANNTNTGSTANLYNYFVRQKGASNGISGIQYMLQTFSDAGANGMEIYTQGASSTLVLGTNATERMRITSSGTVSINTTSPNTDAVLFAKGRTSDGAGYAAGFTNSSGTSLLYIRNDGLTIMNSSYSNLYRINDTGGGFVTLEMENSSRWRINYLGRFSGYGAGALTTDASGNITAASDRTLKDIIRPVENVLENIMDFEPVYFKWNNKTDLDKENVYMSTIAQSIQKHYPDAVGKMADGTLTVQDRAVTAILVQAIKELTEKVKTLENK